MNGKTTVLGIMSGSSLDGLDFCLSSFEKKGPLWEFRIKLSVTVEFPDDLKTLLSKSQNFESEMLTELDITFGKWIGRQINEIEIKFDLISIHGHTVFHSPEKGASLQLGNAEVINRMTGVPTVTNFRNQDIQLGGQGTPLVPMGEKYLFPKFNAFLNLGGICNASFRSDDQWIAGDIGPCNQVFNHLANTLGMPFDDEGRFARSGHINQSLLDNWNSLDFFNSPFPKSLDNQWVRDLFLKEVDCSSEDSLHTFSLFLAQKIATHLNQNTSKQVMITGGGTYNTFLIEQIEKLTDVGLVIPNRELVEFKEALIFAFLGLLRKRGEVNVLSSCTGASLDTSSGDIYSSHQNV